MNTRTDDTARDGEILRPSNALGEQTLAVDLARADFDQAVVTAHRFPRVIDTVIKQMETMACYNDAAAENCIYSLPRGGKPIIGPSIGFANILAQTWGNCVDAGRPTHVDRKEKVVYADGAFHDLQTNRKTVLSVSRRISGRDGRLYADDMIMVTGMAAAAIARRNAILNAVPRALWFPIYEKALHIVRGSVETFAELKEKAMKGFSQFGVKPEQIYAVLGVKGDVDLTLEHIPYLRGMYSALRDGSTTVEEMFDPRRMSGAAFGKVNNPLSDDDDEVHDATTGELKDQPGGGDSKQQTAQEQTAQPTSVAAQTGQTTGAAETQQATQQPTQAQPEVQKDAAEGKPAAKGKSKKADKADDKGPEPKADAAKPAADSAAPVVPKNADEYRTHALARIAGASSVASLDDWWKSERDLRGDCMVVEDVFDELKKAKDKRAGELKGGA